MHEEHGPHDDLPPPPAYSEQEFEQKVSRATDLSLQSSSAVNSQADEDGWETYDEAAFEAISNKLASMELRQNYGQSSSSSSSQVPTHNTSGTHGRRKSTEKVPLSGLGPAPINPLRIEKKGAPSYGQSFEGSSSHGQAGPAKAIRSEPEPPPAFTAEPGPDESELNWSRPSSASSAALSPIDSQLFPAIPHAPLLSHDVNQQSGQRPPEPSHVPQPTYQEQPAVSNQGNPQIGQQPHVPPQADAQQDRDPYAPSGFQSSYQVPPNPSQASSQPSYQQTVPRPLPQGPTTHHHVQPGYQQPSMMPSSNLQPTYQHPNPNPETSYYTPPTQSSYQRGASPPHNSGPQPGFTSFTHPHGSPQVQPRSNPSSPPPSHLNSQESYRNSVSLHPTHPATPNSREMRHQSVAYPSGTDYNVSTPQPIRQSLPVPPRSQPSVPQQPVQHTNMAYVKHEPAPISRLPFNHSLAYGNTFSQSTPRPMSTMFTNRPEPARSVVSNIQYNPRELYNTAISSHLTGFSSRPSASPNRMSIAIGSTTPQQPTLGLTQDAFNPYSPQSIQGNVASQNQSAFPQQTSTYWPNNTATPNFQPQYNSNQNSWSGQPAAVNVSAPMVAQSQNTQQWYSYPSG